jgi:DtxR family Mn-dependent transcriptional regulator
VISPEVETAMLALMENPTTCPHGNPIPGSDYVEPSMITLSSVGVGDGFAVARIPEELEFRDGMLEFLERSNVVPGSEGTVVAISPDGTTTIDVQGAVVGLGRFAAERILVTD